MTPPNRNSRDTLREKAGQFFKEKEKRSSAIFEQMQTDRVVSDAKTAKLRALRLAKEEVDREAALLAPPKKKAPAART
jgi:hypothetical protein